MDIVWMAALALFWAALVKGVDGLAKLERRAQGEKS